MNLSKRTQDTIMDVVFPYVPETFRGLISLIFWHSLLLTSSTPLFRVMNDRWRSDLTLYTLTELFAPAWVQETMEQCGIIDIGGGVLEYPMDGDMVPGTNSVQGTDKSFGPHAFLGLLWLLVSYFQLIHAKRVRPKMHTYFGYLSVLVFLGHVAAALHSIYVDVVLHTALAKTILVLTLISSGKYMVISIVVAIRKEEGWEQHHKDHMMRCYLVSIRGAGPIRAVAQMQDWFGVGSHLCQKKYGGLASECQLEYVNRMFLTALFDMYLWGVYVRQRGDAKMTKDYLTDAAILLSETFGMIAFGYLPYADKIVKLVFGEPRSPQSHTVFFVLTMLIIVVAANDCHRGLAPKDDMQKWNERKTTAPIHDCTTVQYKITTGSRNSWFYLFPRRVLD
jgi:hypothetical protein